MGQEVATAAHRSGGGGPFLPNRRQKHGVRRHGHLRRGSSQLSLRQYHGYG
jgi:hypothetical protein